MSESELVMPFVTVTSKGGPHDDDSYVAGYECGWLDAALALEQPVTARRVVRSESVPQIDLIAMRHGYTATYEEHPEYAEWTTATLTRSGVS